MPITESKQKARRFRRRFAYFPVGETPDVSGVTIVAHVDMTTSNRTTRYLVRYLCCGSEGEIAHKSIESRKKRDSKDCRACGISRVVDARDRARACACGLSKAKTKAADPMEPYGVTPPEWPKPPSVPIGPSLWCDIGAQR